MTQKGVKVRTGRKNGFRDQIFIRLCFFADRKIRSVMVLKNVFRRLAGILAVLILLSGSAGRAESPAPGLEDFPVYHGDRESRKIAITMDDVNEREWVWKAAELCEKYGITMTFFPIGVNLLPEDRENWQKVLDTGCEIGNHSLWHEYFGDNATGKIVYSLLTFQQTLDEMLGYHYEVRWFRPPYGNIKDSKGSMWDNMRILKRIGYQHILLWDVSFSQGFKPADIMKDVKNGSIILFHARKRDYNCLVEFIPWLLEQGYEPVTVSELFGFDLPQTGGDLYVYNKDDFR